MSYEAYAAQAAQAKSSAASLVVGGLDSVVEQNWSAMQCSIDDPDGCEACGS